MSAGFKVWNLLHNDFLSHNPHIAGACVTAGIFIVGGIAYRLTTSNSQLTKAGIASAVEEELVPSENFSFRNTVESLGEYIRDRAKDIIGDHYAQFLPLLSFIFLWILLNNLIGIIPGFGSPTDDINTTLSMGIFVFLYYNIMGFVHNGAHYFEHFTGHLKGVLLYTIGILMIPLELISHSIRPLTLGMRLRTNIYADHSVYHTIAGLSHDFAAFLGVKLGVIGEFMGYIFTALAPVPIVILGILVCVIQALVFTLLTSVYISIATAHEEH
ncbi:MAG: F0F1 ATP synthase subunit A [Bdellovibrionota bacterium]